MHASSSYDLQDIVYKNYEYRFQFLQVSEDYTGDTLVYEIAYTCSGDI